MATDLIRYDLMVQEALRGVVRRVLSDISRYGLPGEHHLYISFKTQHTGVRISNRLREQYPEEMTIVLQHQFWDLKVHEHGFEVVLSFKNVHEQLVVPYDSVIGFFDPSVQFGLKFEAEEGEATASAAPATTPAKKSEKSLVTAPAKAPKKPADAKAEDAVAEEAPGEGPKVVSLDAFRKKP
ncbi:SspB family protein [Terrarubrum flagellatum]|uniref:SspB family protein n=1 Tax=Terrirubrum flagellatum TaxID=2895980 RepID=UPI0031452400